MDIKRKGSSGKVMIRIDVKKRVTRRISKASQKAECKWEGPT